MQANVCAIGHNVTVGNLVVLDRPTYGISQTAHLLGLRPDRVRSWLDGYHRHGRKYPPVVRADHTGSEIVTWGEFIELGYLREYRRADVALQRIRPVIARLREGLGTPYPLAHHRPWVYDRELVLAAQEAEGLEPALAIVVRTGQEIMLSVVAEQFVKRIEFEGDTARRWYPAGRFSPVVVDPTYSFGMPTVAGVATENLYELVAAGETIADVANGYDLTEEQVRSACMYEETVRRLAA